MHQLLPSGRVVPQTNTKKFSHIKNGHLIKLRATVPTVWDESFEKKFGDIDSSVPSIVRWLESLPFEPRENVVNRRERFVSATQSWGDLNRLLELMMSLVVRGPRLRHSVQGYDRVLSEANGNERPAGEQVSH